MAKPKEFLITGTITIEVDFEIYAEDQIDAQKKASAMLKDYYHLDNQGERYLGNSTLDIDANEYED